jgi:hypothetical protein
MPLTRDEKIKRAMQETTWYQVGYDAYGYGLVFDDFAGYQPSGDDEADFILGYNDRRDACMKDPLGPHAIPASTTQYFALGPLPDLGLLCLNPINSKMDKDLAEIEAKHRAIITIDDARYVVFSTDVIPVPAKVAIAQLIGLHLVGAFPVLKLPSYIETAGR